jgi:dUTPase|nr:MAG TPA: deoxyuridine 5'-triphosphate nucleotidohydrolase [Caudoviricetes sp.]
MYEKLVPDAKCDHTDLNHARLAAAETVTILSGKVQTVSTGLRSNEPLLVSFLRGLGRLDMCTLLTTGIMDGNEVRVAILNRGTEPVTIHAGEWLLHVCKMPLKSTEC